MSRVLACLASLALLVATVRLAAAATCFDLPPVLQNDPVQNEAATTPSVAAMSWTPNLVAGGCNEALEGYIIDLVLPSPMSPLAALTSSALNSYTITELDPGQTAAGFFRPYGQWPSDQDEGSDFDRFSRCGVLVSPDRSGADELDDCMCPAGFGRTTPTEPCVQCAAGTYRSGFGNEICTECPAGTDSPAGATSLAQCVCPAGDYLDDPGPPSKICTACPIGTWKAALSDATSCNECDLVTETTVGNSSTSAAACVCKDGYFRNATSGECELCPLGSYSDSLNAGSCTACPEGFTTLDEGATSAAACAVCAPGRFGADCSGLCACADGTLCIDGLTGSGNCTCSSGSGLSGPSCDQCEVTTYYGPHCNMTVECFFGLPSFGFLGTGTCVACHADRYDHSADNRCTTCAPNNSGVDCRTCLAGSGVNPADVGGLCTPCSPGRFNPSARMGAPCQQCAPGSFSTQPRATGCELCARGEYQPSPGAVGCLPCGLGMTTGAAGAADIFACSPCPENTFKDVVGAGVCLQCPGNQTTDGETGASVPTACGCPPGEGGGELAGVPTCLPCTPGYVSQSHGTQPCTICPRGTTWASASAGCLPCPFGGYCTGGAARPVPDNGFHPVPGLPLSAAVFEPCTPARVCLRGGLCRDGHGGTRCAFCLDGWVKNPQTGVCEKCPSSIPYIFVGIALLGGILCLLLVKLARKNTAFFTAASVGFNYLQLIAILSSFNIKWPSWTQRFFEVLSAANIDLQLFKPECLVSNSSEAYTTIWIIKLCAPWFLLSLFLIGFGAYKLYAQLRGVAPIVQASMKYAFTNAAVMAMFVMYLLVTNTALEIFPCTKQVDGKHTMNREPSIRCYEGRWNKLLAGSLVTMIMFSLFMPAAVAFVLYRRRFNLWKRKNLSRFGLLYLRYRPQFYFFEIAVLCRKFGVVFGKVVFSFSVVGQVVTAMLVVSASLILQLKSHPYATMRINRLEVLMLSCATLVLTVAFGYALADGDLSTATATLLGVVLIVVVCATVLVIVICIILEIRKTYRLIQHGLVGRYVVDRLDVWQPFFDAELHLLSHTQKPDEGGSQVAGSSIVMTFASEKPVQLVCEIFLESVITRRTDASKDRLAADLSPLWQPKAQRVDVSADLRLHTVVMRAPRPGHYVATFAVVDCSDGVDARARRVSNTDMERQSRWHKWWSSFVAFVDGSVTDQAHAPSMVRAMMIDGAERVIRFRVTASPEWEATDAMVGSKVDLSRGGSSGELVSEQPWVEASEMHSITTMDEAQLDAQFGGQLETFA
ncbi:uncharacterized protein AMSG_06390 [Thecamonas trahens ATCC 50062]|uniref:Tyrosine-protein kinase ephrin type A/B receptor-like domain-containing protein n=1 Tax=Thecamonas trahens ATCC 50062 TaxID=461836 RepID=A0A0L0DDD9_THETB|nr:hypothetical protein AMSG_06390 [Thecamonas trahens ATCC 50062]KNC50235.1 hypothetical protein AMSG_06390 [Thecamonas trahens ATCC 50062]|eukprot:XP_013757065.1 hypothetical protein AMSG_06390 [Thecamonas trahens ATCC 50062]